MRGSDFNESDDSVDENVLRKMDREMHRRTKKNGKNRKTFVDDGLDTHKRNPYKREKFDPRDYMVR